MRKKEGDEKDEGYPFLVKRERRADFGVADIPEDAGARSLAASSIGVMAAMRVRQGVSHARDGRPCEDQALVSVPSSGPRGLVFTVLDGHFGTRAAMMAKHRLAKVLPGLAAEAPAEDGYGPALASAFKELDALICGQCEEGCTATVVPVWETAPGRLAVQSVNVGDSFAVLLPLSPGSEPRELTGNHRVDQDAEFERIASYNLSAEKLGGYDRGHTRLLGFQLARCLGDAMFKTECPAIVSDPR